MAYKFYCTDCGQLITQMATPSRDTKAVLFNMQNLVLEDESLSFQNLTMYMTQYEIDQLLVKGVLLDSGYRKIRLTFADVMRIISGYFNLNKPMLASLTLDQVKEYLRPKDDGPVIRHDKKKKSGGSRFVLQDEEEETPAEAEEDDDAPQVMLVPPKPETPPAILALNELWGGTAGNQVVEQTIRAELEMLQRAFGDQDFLEILITPRTEEDNEKNPVVVGYQLIYPKSGKHATYRLRVCPNCHGPIYEHAGRAEHQTVVFMGTPGSGKTSAILAMTHYLHNAADPIWENSNGVDQLSYFQDSHREKLMAELDDFKLGIAPQRTDISDRCKAYSSTFWFQDEETGGHLLTLTDMPGEMMAPANNPRKINEQALRNSHQAALCCDAFVICFDATTVFRATMDENGDPEKVAVRNNARNEVISLVDKLDQLQRLRTEMIRERDGVKANLNYVPTIILITKDMDLERQEGKLQPKTAIPTELLYCFQAEREFIQSNQVYNSILQTLSKYDKLRKSYHATLRCSPFGYNAPGRGDINYGGRSIEEVRTPTPKNIDEAVCWLLKLIGVMPAPGVLTMEDGALTRENYRLSRVQYRSDKPKEGEELEEALSRCTLFENPGYFDEQVVEAYTEGAFAKLRLKTSMMAKWITNDMDPR